MDPNAPDGSQGGFPGGNNNPYQGGWNPFIYGYHGPPSWYSSQGFPQVPPNTQMFQQSGSLPMEEPSEQNNSPDMEEVDAPPALAPTAKGGTKKVVTNRIKSSNFSPDEDVNIVKSWLEISCDPITNTGQKNARMWDRIVDRYNMRRGSYPERSVRSLQSRWDTINTQSSRFASFYADAIRENPSGMSDADKTTYAATNFAKVVKRNYAFMHCWGLLKDEPKWQDLKSKSSGNVAAGDGFGEDSNNDHDETLATGSPPRSAGKRPMGRDTAKAEKKKAKASGGSTSSSEYASRMQDLSLQRISILQDSEVRKNDRFQQLAIIDEKRFEEMRSHNKSLVDIEQQKIWLKREKHEMERKREEKLEEERILGIDLDACPPRLRQYYEARQEEIMQNIEARLGKIPGQ